MNINQAAELFHRYGNVGRDTNDLLITAPTEDQLEAAMERCIYNLRLAENVLRKHFKMKEFDYIEGFYIGRGT